MSSTRARTTDYYEGTVDAVYRVTSGAILHLGIFLGDEPRRVATTRTKDFLASHLALDEGTRVIDLGSGYGDAARYLAGRFGCNIVCVNLIHGQNRSAAALNMEHRLDHRIGVITADFADVPLSGGGFDLVWSQEAFLHAADRAGVLKTAARLLAPGGRLIFTDILQIGDMPIRRARRIFERVRVESLENFESYLQKLQAAGLEVERVVDLSDHVAPSYRDHLRSLRLEQQYLAAAIGAANLKETIGGMEAWVAAAEERKLGWGMFAAHKS